jgi:hypothetical protein
MLCIVCPSLTFFTTIIKVAIAISQLQEMPPFLPNGNHNTLKYQVAKSFCSSYRYNPRNIERVWYGPWCQVLSDLVEEFDNMVVIPQFPLWFIPGDEEPDESDDAPATDDESLDELDCFRAIPDEWDEDERHIKRKDLDLIADITTDSIGTLPGSNVAELFPDFAIVHLLAKRLPQGHPHFKRLHGIQITHECCPVVVENKKFPKRSLIGDEFVIAASVLLQDAREQLGMQCYHLFKKYPCSMFTIAIAAAGDLWTYKKVHRNEVPTPDGDEMVTDKWDTLIWPPFTTLGTGRSNLMLMEVHEALKLKPPLNLDPDNS